MVVWLKPCESRSLPGALQKNPQPKGWGFSFVRISGFVQRISDDQLLLYPKMQFEVSSFFEEDGLRSFVWLDISRVDVDLPRLDLHFVYANGRGSPQNTRPASPSVEVPG